MSSTEFDQTEDVRQLVYWACDEELPDLDSVLSKLTQNSHANMNNDNTTDSRHYHINNDSALTKYDDNGYYPLPALIRDAFENNDNDNPFSMGILAEIETVWVAHDSKLYLWHYRDANVSFTIDLRENDNIVVDIVSVALAYPKPRVFTPVVKYVLVVATTEEVLLFAVVYCDNFAQIEYIETPFKCALTNIDTRFLKIVSSQCGRIFLGTTELQLIEIQYSNDNYRVDFPFMLTALFQPFNGDQVENRNKCRKIKHGNFNLFRINDRWNDNPDDSLADIAVDNVRRLIYVISVKGVLDIFHLGDNYDRTTLVVSKKSILSNLKENYLISDIEERLLKESGDALVSNIFVIPYNESKKLCCVVVLQNGVRVYISVGKGLRDRKDHHWGVADNTVGVVCQYVRFPPSPRAIHYSGKDHRVDGYNVTDWDEQTDLEPTLVNNVADNRVSNILDLNPTPAKFHTTLYSCGVFLAAVSYDEVTGIDQLISIAPTHTKGSNIKEAIGAVGAILNSKLDGPRYDAGSELWEAEDSRCFIGGLFCKIYDIKEDVSLLDGNNYDYAMINALYLTSRFPRSKDQRPIPPIPLSPENNFQLFNRSQHGVDYCAMYPSVSIPGYIGPSVVENDKSLSYLRYTYQNVEGTIISSDLLMQQLPWVNSARNPSFLMLTNNGVHRIVKMKPIDELVDIFILSTSPIQVINDEEFKRLLQEDSRVVYTKRRDEHRSRGDHAELLIKLKRFADRYSDTELCIMCHSIICGVPVIDRLQVNEVERLKRIVMCILKEYDKKRLLKAERDAPGHIACSLSTEALRLVAGRILRPILFRFIAEKNPFNNNIVEFNCIWTNDIINNIMVPLIKLGKHIEDLRLHSGTTALIAENSNHNIAEDSVLKAIMDRDKRTSGNRSTTDYDKLIDLEKIRQSESGRLKKLWRFTERAIQALYIIKKLKDLREANLVPINLDMLDSLMFKDFALSSKGFYDIQKVVKNVIRSILTNSSINLAHSDTYDFQINKAASNDLVQYLRDHANIFFTASDMSEYESDVSLQELKILLSKSYSTMSSKVDKKVKEYTNQMLAAMKSRSWTHCNDMTIVKLEEKCNFLIDNLGRLGYDGAIEVCLALAGNFGHERHTVGPTVNANYTAVANTALYRDPSWMDEFHERDLSDISALNDTLQEFNIIQENRNEMKIKCYKVLIELIMNIKKDKNEITEKQRDILDEGVFDMQSSYEDRKEELFTYVLTYVTKCNQESDFLKLLCTRLLDDGDLDQSLHQDLISLESTSYVENFLKEKKCWLLLYDHYMKNYRYDAAAELMYEMATVLEMEITIDKRLVYLEKAKSSYDLFIANVSENIFAQGRGGRGNVRLTLADTLDFNIQLCKLQEEYFTNLLNDNIPFREEDLNRLFNDKIGLESLLDRMRASNKHDFLLRLMSIIPVDIMATLHGRFDEQYFKNSLREIIRTEFDRAVNNNNVDRLKKNLQAALKKVTTQFIDPDGNLANRILDPAHASSMLIINNLIQLLMEYVVDRADIWNIDCLVQLLLSLKVDKAMLLEKFIQLITGLISDIQKMNYLKAGVCIMKDWIKQSRNVASEASYREYNSLKQNKDLKKFDVNVANSWICRMSEYRRALDLVGVVGHNDLTILGKDLTDISEEMKTIGKGVGMPLIGVPTSVTPELLYALARCGHGDRMVIADANFPSDSVATSCVIKAPIRVSGSTSDILKDILNLLPLDQYLSHKIYVMDRVQSDKDKDLHVPAYEALRQAAAIEAREVSYVERFDFYKMAKEGFVVIQTDDTNLYANVIISKGVL